MSESNPSSESSTSTVVEDATLSSSSSASTSSPSSSSSSSSAPVNPLFDFTLAPTACPLLAATTPATFKTELAAIVKRITATSTATANSDIIADLSQIHALLLSVYQGNFHADLLKVFLKDHFFATINSLMTKSYAGTIEELDSVQAILQLTLQIALQYQRNNLPPTINPLVDLNTLPKTDLAPPQPLPLRPRSKRPYVASNVTNTNNNNSSNNTNSNDPASTTQLPPSPNKTSPIPYLNGPYAIPPPLDISDASGPVYGPELPPGYNAYDDGEWRVVGPGGVVLGKETDVKEQTEPQREAAANTESASNSTSDTSIATDTASTAADTATVTAEDKPAEKTPTDSATSTTANNNATNSSSATSTTSSSTGTVIPTLFLPGPPLPYPEPPVEHIPVSYVSLVRQDESTYPAPALNASSTFSTVQSREFDSVMFDLIELIFDDTKGFYKSYMEDRTPKKPVVVEGEKTDDTTEKEVEHGEITEDTPELAEFRQRLAVDSWLDVWKNNKWHVGHITHDEKGEFRIIYKVSGLPRLR